MFKAAQRLEKHEMKLEVTIEAKDYLAKEGFDKLYGARPLRRVIQRLIEDPLSGTLLTTKSAPVIRCWSSWSMGRSS